MKPTLLLSAALLLLTACHGDDDSAADSGSTDMSPVDAAIDAPVDAPVCDAEAIPTTTVVQCPSEPQSADNCHGYPLFAMDTAHASDGYPVGCRAILPIQSEFPRCGGHEPAWCICMVDPAGTSSPSWVCPL